MIRLGAAEIELSRHALQRFRERGQPAATRDDALASLRRSRVAGRRLKRELAEGHFGRGVRFAAGMVYALDGETQLLWVLRPARSDVLVVLTCLDLGVGG